MQHINGKGLTTTSQDLAHGHCSLLYTTLWYFQHFVNRHPLITFTLKALW